MILLINEDITENMSIFLYNSLVSKGADCCIISQDSLPIKNNITLFVKDSKLLGELYIEGERIDIRNINAIYTRLSGSKIKENISEASKAEIEQERLIYFDTFFEYIDAMVINRNKSQFPNSSKLYQSGIIKNYGFNIPNSIISNDINEVKEFIEAKKDKGIIYKSASAERSKVQNFKKEDFDKLEFIKYCPHLFQECVHGADIRVHALATGETFACRIGSETSDYRYDADRNVEIIDLPQKIKDACVKMTLDFGLYLSGIDLRITPDGEYYCFEVNPSPAFSWYEEITGMPISDAVAEMMINSDKYKNLAVRRFL